jgi:hypothetical protein
LLLDYGRLHYCRRQKKAQGKNFDEKIENHIVNKWDSHAFEIPMSGIVAFAIVSLLRSPTNDSDDPLTFTAFNLEFSGPVAPTTLWVVVYLTIVVSFKLLKKR